MPIQKATGARLVKQGVPYDIVSRDVIQQITDPAALAIYVYLLTKPANWVVRRQDILNHFEGLGRKRYTAGMKYLKDIGAVWIADVRDEGGRITDRVIVVEAAPETPNCTLSTIKGKPQLSKTTLREKRPLKDTEIIKETEIIKDTENPPTPQGDDERFIEFYSAYPKKVGKQAAAKAFKKLSPSPDLLATILTDIQQRVDQGEWHPNDNRKQYIPGPAPYLNGKKWDDEIIPRGEASTTTQRPQLTDAGFDDPFSYKPGGDQ